MTYLYDDHFDTHIDLFQLFHVHFESHDNQNRSVRRSRCQYTKMQQLSFYTADIESYFKIATDVCKCLK